MERVFGCLATVVFALIAVGLSPLPAHAQSDSTVRLRWATNSLGVSLYLRERGASAWEYVGAGSGSGRFRGGVFEVAVTRDHEELTVSDSWLTVEGPGVDVRVRRSDPREWLVASAIVGVLGLVSIVAGFSASAILVATGGAHTDNVFEPQCASCWFEEGGAFIVGGGGALVLFLIGFAASDTAGVEVQVTPLERTR